MGMTPALAKLVALWQELPRRPGSTLPPRSSFDAEAALNDHHRISVIKRYGRYDIFAELVRLDVAQNWQRPIAGISVFDLATPAMRDNIARFHECLLLQPCGALLTQSAPDNPTGQASLTSLYLPFSDRDGKDTVIIGFTVSTAPGLAASLKTQLVVSFDQIETATFIDLGHGVPNIVFDEAPIPQARTMSRKGWWERFLPQQRELPGGQASAQNRSDIEGDRSGHSSAGRFPQQPRH